jgi:citrate synthase
MGLRPRLYTPIFLASRVAGWAAHIIEQQAENRLFRPRAVYKGPL